MAGSGPSPSGTSGSPAGSVQALTLAIARSEPPSALPHRVCDAKRFSAEGRMRSDAVRAVEHIDPSHVVMPCDSQRTDAKRCDPATRLPHVGSHDIHVIASLRHHRRRLGEGRAAGPFAVRQGCGQGRWQQAQNLALLIILLGQDPRRFCRRFCRRRGRRAEEEQGGQGTRAQGEAARRGRGGSGGRRCIVLGGRRRIVLIGGIIFFRPAGTARCDCAASDPGPDPEPEPDP